jgi:hypothetical protein
VVIGSSNAYVDTFKRIPCLDFGPCAGGAMILGRPDNSSIVFTKDSNNDTLAQAKALIDEWTDQDLCHLSDDAFALSLAHHNIEHMVIGSSNAHVESFEPHSLP